MSTQDIHAAAPQILKPWQETLPIHQAAELTPLMTPEQLRELADDIKKNGLREPISISEGDGHDLKFGKKYLMDGRNRMNALALLGIDVFRYKLKRGKKTEEIDWHREITCGDVTNRVFIIEYVSDPGDFVKSKNLHRLHLNGEQRRDLLARRLKANPELSNRQIAKMTGLDDKAVAAVRNDPTAGIPAVEKIKGADGKLRRPRRAAQPKPTGEPPQSPSARQAKMERLEEAGSSVEVTAKSSALDSVAAPVGEPHVRLPMALQLPSHNLQYVLDHLAAYTADQRAELIETLRLLAGQCTAWAETLADEPATFEENLDTAITNRKTDRKSLH